MFISKSILILFNSFFIILDLTVSVILWIHIYQLESIKVDLPEAEIESIVATKKCGIVLTSGIVIVISSIGMVGAYRGNANLLITYDVVGLLAIIVLSLGWRNYQTIWPIYISVISTLFTSLIVALIYIKTIKDEPYRIRRELLLVNMASMRESIVY